jgi:hypothetical protein
MNNFNLEQNGLTELTQDQQKDIEGGVWGWILLAAVAIGVGIAYLIWGE